MSAADRNEGSSIYMHGTDKRKNVAGYHDGAPQKIHWRHPVDAFLLRKIWIYYLFLSFSFSSFRFRLHCRENVLTYPCKGFLLLFSSFFLFLHPFMSSWFRLSDSFVSIACITKSNVAFGIFLLIVFWFALFSNVGKKCAYLHTFWSTNLCRCDIYFKWKW